MNKMGKSSSVAHKLQQSESQTNELNIHWTGVRTCRLYETNDNYVAVAPRFGLIMIPLLEWYIDIMILIYTLQAGFRESMSCACTLLQR
jgi:hypothetical protein